MLVHFLNYSLFMYWVNYLLNQRWETKGWNRGEGSEEGSNVKQVCLDYIPPEHFAKSVTFFFIGVK